MLKGFDILISYKGTTVFNLIMCPSIVSLPLHLLLFSLFLSFSLSLSPIYSLLTES